MPTGDHKLAPVTGGPLPARPWNEAPHAPRSVHEESRPGGGPGPALCGGGGPEVNAGKPIEASAQT